MSQKISSANTLLSQQFSVTSGREATRKGGGERSRERKRERKSWRETQEPRTLARYRLNCSLVSSMFYHRRNSLQLLVPSKSCEVDSRTEQRKKRERERERVSALAGALNRATTGCSRCSIDTGFLFVNRSTVSGDDDDQRG